MIDLVAVTPTFPSRETLDRLRFRPLDAFVGIAVLLLIYAAVRVGAGARAPAHPSSTISLDPSNLPYYAARSLLRMFIALFFAYAFSLGYSYVAARSRRWRRVLIPALDILQSVPVLGFLAITVTFFVALFPGSELGFECAAIFAVFTSQAWNITFSFYHSLISQPAEFNEASKLMGLSRWKRFWAVDVPGGAIGLVWNGMMSFGGSWFFLTASELITVNSRSYTLPGVGSYVGVAESEGKLGYVLWGIATMIIMILVVNFFFWRPLVAYVDKFRVEQSESGLKARSLVLDALHRSSWPAMLGRGRRVFTQPVNTLMGRVTGIDDQSLAGSASRRRAADRAFAIVIIVVLGYGLYSMLAYIATGSDGMAVFGTAFADGFVTFLRVVVVVTVSSLIWVPVGVWIGFNPRVAQFMQPIVQVLASFPANFVFPFAIVIFLDLGISLNFGAIALMALGTQWYVLFNVIAGASAVPSDLKEAMDNLGVHGRERWRRLILPAIFPAYVTGAITAAGGAWNATIVAEIVRYNHHQLVAKGLGSFIALNTGHLPALFAGLLVMAIYVTGLNVLLWRRLYHLAETKFALA
ncbi:MAG TPA: ABC transporter permease subunit [Streptosporangiaceae bacterium]|nr:ABC transporter permease subunit [Streptosporangiaceae bacterium]